MQQTAKRITAIVLAAAACAGGYYVFKGKAEPPAAQPRNNPVLTVKTVRALQKAMPITVEANGYVTALNTVEVRPQTQNIVREVHVREGQDVRAGQLLFTLDERSDQSGLAKARADLAKSRADLAQAEMNLKRNEELAAKNFVSQAVVDTARSQAEALRSTVRASEAAAQSSSVALGYNRITASISGRIGAINVRPGSLAQPAGTPMVTIAQLDPVAVSFTLPERELANIAATYPEGNAIVTAHLANDQTLQGKLYFIDNAADTQSGTIRMKARFDNSDRKLWPGTYVTLSLVTRTVQNAITVPAQALVTGPVKQFVYVVQQDGTVKPQDIETLAIQNGVAAVSGLPPGSRVVIEGSKNLRPGSKVREAEAPGAPREAAGPQAGPGVNDAPGAASR